MTGVFAEFDTGMLAGISRRLNAWAMRDHARAGLDALGAFAVSAAEERITSTRAAPDGTPWAAWSENYAATRIKIVQRKSGSKKIKKGTLLRDSNLLLRRLTYHVNGAESVEAGSNLVYAAIHQFGGTDEMPARLAAIPARPYLGLSDDQLAEAADIIQDWLGSSFGIVDGGGS
jgi:phage virion morphogenesis protein